MARDRLVQSDSKDLDAVLNLWSLRLSALARLRLSALARLRLSALARLRLSNQTAAEITNLFMALHSVPSAVARAHLFAHVLPFELEVLHARVKRWASGARGYVDTLGALLGACCTRARRAKSEGNRQMWMEHGARVGLIAVSQFVEMKLAAMPDLRSAHLPAGRPARRSRGALRGGRAGAGRQRAEEEMNAVLLATARGKWDGVSAAL